MTNYRDEAPKFFKDLTSDGILSYFEDSRTTEEELNWFKTTITSDEYQMKQNPITKYNWGKMKTTFAKKFFPELAPENKPKNLTTEDRLAKLFN